jgi:hypothetical protein
MNTPGNKPSNGHFVITLDFELYWGVRDSRSFESYKNNILGVRQAMPAMLESFARHNVKVTFATVGFLFCRNKQELKDHSPTVLPDYPDKKFSPFENGYLDSIGDSEQDDPYHYGASMIREIMARPEHEIGTHTFSHYYCLEGSSLAAFKADLEAAKSIASTYGVGLESIVFPRNQYNGDILKACLQAGITSYRGNEEAAIYQPRSSGEQSAKIRVTRLLDSYVNLTGHHCFELRKPEEGRPLNIPASRFLRPYMAKLKFLEGLKVKRIRESMTHAAKNNLVFHLWWHPHNFGANLKENIKNLDAVLEHYAHLRGKYGFDSITMKQLTTKFNQYQ